MMSKHKTRRVKDNSARYRAWTAMRILQNFKVSEIIDISEIKKENIRVFFRYLLKAGFIRKKKDGSYSLLLNNGPKAPVILTRESRVYEPNTKKYFDCKQ